MAKAKKKWDLRLKSRILDLIGKRSKMTDADVDTFTRQLMDKTKTKCTVSCKGIKQAFTYCRQVMELYDLKTVHELVHYFAQTDKRAETLAKQYQKADVLHKIILEWNVSKVFELDRIRVTKSQPVSQAHPANTDRESVRLEPTTDKKTDTGTRQFQNRSSKQAASCY